MPVLCNIPSKENPSDYSATGLVVHVGLDVNTNSAYNLEIFLNRKDFSNANQGTTLYFTNVSYIVPDRKPHNSHLQPEYQRYLFWRHGT